MIGIITAMPQETDPIIEKINLKPLKKYFTTEFYQNWNITLVVTWIWKTQASIGTTLTLKEFNFDKIINIGIAGNTMLEKKVPNLRCIFCKPSSSTWWIFTIWVKTLRLF